MTYSSKLTRRRISIDGANLFHFQLWIVAPVNLYTKYFYITVNPISIRNKKKSQKLFLPKYAKYLSFLLAQQGKTIAIIRTKTETKMKFNRFARIIVFALMLFLIISSIYHSFLVFPLKGIRIVILIILALLSMMMRDNIRQVVFVHRIPVPATKSPRNITQEGVNQATGNKWNTTLYNYSCVSLSPSLIIHTKIQIYICTKYQH